ncbi:hypothetical protein EE612_031149, partial [Oryza sativa]
KTPYRKDPADSEAVLAAAREKNKGVSEHYF